MAVLKKARFFRVGGLKAISATPGNFTSAREQTVQTLAVQTRLPPCPLGSSQSFTVFSCFRRQRVTGESLQNKYARLIKRHRRETVVTPYAVVKHRTVENGNFAGTAPSNVINGTSTISRGTKGPNTGPSRAHAAHFTAATFSAFACPIDIFPGCRKTRIR